MPKPLFSIVVPAYNAAPYIELTLQSALEQSEKNIEVIVVDNASCDGSWNIIEAFRDPRLVKIRKNRTTPMVANWQDALDCATGDYATLLSADDILCPQHVAVCLEALTSQNDILIAHGPNHLIDKNGITYSVAKQEPRRIETSAQVFFQLVESNKISLVSAGFNLAAMRRADIRIDFRIQALADWALWLDLCNIEGKVIYTGIPTSKYRVLSSGITASSKSSMIWDFESALVPLTRLANRTNVKGMQRVLTREERSRIKSAIAFCRTSLFAGEITKALIVFRLLMPLMKSGPAFYRLLGLHKIAMDEYGE